MQTQNTNKILFPTETREKNSLELLMSKLESMGQGHKKTAEASETITDDFALLPDEKEKIEQQEAEMRELLSLLGVDYDALIAMDGRSVYSRAVAANAAVLEFVKNAKNPVLEAVKISLKFKPYAEFMEKYGSEPNEILENLKAELSAQNSPKVAEEKEVEMAFKSPFSSPSFASKMKEEKSTKNAEVSLSEIFKR